ncbi:ras-related and estrogen-regulated growth inhibitor-like isoform X1 [Montipora capricornis]|uniref:ras-related and estrogen-regulated growth inhibitor-like isoform X1 n=1 Tax=Montipora capricornis TaxID=246305 RepID=UPI0035F1AD90
MNSLVPAEARFLVLGSKAVGKSALLVRFLTKRFIGEYQSLMQVTYNHTIKLDDEDLTFDIRDSLEKGDTRQVSKDIRWADAFLVVYAVTDRNSFNNAIQLVESIYDRKGTDELHIALLGNKMDLEHFRKVSTMEGQSAAEQLGCMFFEVSASENYNNVQEALNVVFRKVSRHKKFLKQANEKRKSTHPQIEKKKQKFGNSLFNWKTERKRSPRRAETL